MSEMMNIKAWMKERRDNCLNEAETNEGDEERVKGWSEDASYFEAFLVMLDEMDTQLAMLERKFERAGGICEVAHRGVPLGAMSWASNVENSIVNMRQVVNAAKGGK